MELGENLKIDISDDKIMQMSKDKFRAIVCNAIENSAIQYLNRKAASHSKSEDLIKPRLNKEQYFEDQRFSRSEVELLFALRTKTVRGIKANFTSQYGNNNIACDLCDVAVCCQEHLLSCVKLKTHVDIPGDACYSDLYRNTDRQLEIVRIFKKLLRTRELLLERTF